MGAAKHKGPRELRIAAAQEQQRRDEPINIECKTCKAILNGFELISHSAAGAAWQKTCECGAVTTAVVQSQHSTLTRAFKSTLAIADKVTGTKNEAVSVSFLEKTVDTVETGLVRLPAL